MIFFQYSQKYLKGACLHKCLIFWITFSQNNNVASKKATQQCLLALLEKWKRAVDSGQMFGNLLTDLSKAFDILDHKLLIAKLKTRI